jgi:hypothetical protein
LKVGGVKMKKNEKKKSVLQFEKTYFLYCKTLFGIEKDTKVFGHKQAIGDGPVYRSALKP